MTRKGLAIFLAVMMAAFLVPYTRASAEGALVITIASHMAGQLEAEVDAQKGISAYTDITGLVVAGGTLNNTDRIFLYTSGMSANLQTIDWTATSLDYSGYEVDPEAAPNLLPQYAFGNWSKLASVKLPDSITKISEWAFSNCGELTSVTLPSALSQIEYNVFYNSSKLTSITLPANPVGFICHPNAFTGIASDAALYVTPGTQSAWDAKDFFATDGKLNGVRIENLAPLLSNITAQRTSETSAAVAFYSSEAGTYYYAVVEAGAAAPAIDTSTGGAAISGTQKNTVAIGGLLAGKAYDVYLAAKDTLGNVTDLPTKVELETYVAPVDVVIVNHVADALNSELNAALTAHGLSGRYDKIKSLTIQGGNIGSDDWSVFINLWMAAAIERLDLSGTAITEVPSYGFWNYTFREVLLPATLESIDEMAFYGCTALMKLNLPAAVPPIVGSTAFDDIPLGASVLVPKGSKALYLLANDGNTTDAFWYGFLVITEEEETGETTVAPSVGGASANVTGTNAAFSAVAFAGTLAIDERGFVYGMGETPAIGATGYLKAAAGSGAGSYAVTVSGLLPNTKYHARAYMISGGALYYGGVFSFTTGAGTSVPNTGSQQSVFGFVAAGGAVLLFACAGTLRFAKRSGKRQK